MEKLYFLDKEDLTIDNAIIALKKHEEFLNKKGMTPYFSKNKFNFIKNSDGQICKNPSYYRVAVKKDNGGRANFNYFEIFEKISAHLKRLEVNNFEKCNELRDSLFEKKKEKV